MMHQQQAAATYFTYQRLARSIEGIGVYREGEANVAEPGRRGRAARVTTARISATLFRCSRSRRFSAVSSPTRRIVRARPAGAHQRGYVARAIRRRSRRSSAARSTSMVSVARSSASCRRASSFPRPRPRSGRRFGSTPSILRPPPSHTARSRASSRGRHGRRRRTRLRRSPPTRARVVPEFRLGDHDAADHGSSAARSRRWCRFVRTSPAESPGPCGWWPPRRRSCCSSPAPTSPT